MLKYLKYTALSLLGLAAGLVLAELAARSLPRYRFDAMFQVSHIDWVKSYRASPLTGYELIPNCSPAFNSLGMRDKEYTVKKPAGVFRIVVLGDSITQNGIWSDVTESILNERRRCEVLNCGVSGWGLFNYWADLKYRRIGLSPDMVLVGFCLNDVIDGDTANTVLVNGKNDSLVFRINTKAGWPTRFDPVLLKSSALCRIAYAISNSRAAYNRSPDGDPVRIRSMLAEMKLLSKNRLYAVIFPYLKPLAEYNKRERKEYEATEKYLGEAGIEYLDLTGYFNGFGDRITEFRLRPDDQIHFNEEANRLKGALIARWLEPRISGAAEKR